MIAKRKTRREQVFQQLLRLEVGRTLPCVRLWRQPTGEIRTDKGTWVDCAPVGAADLTGIVRPEGWRLEVECKGKDTPVEPEQLHWYETMREFGAVALFVRDDGTPESEARGVETIRAAIEARRAGY